MQESRPQIPEPLQRKVRQKCKFGCVICGCPVYQIDHIQDWSEVKEHKLENLTLLCSTHHDQKTKGVLSREVVAKKTANIKDREFTGFADLNFSHCRLILGNNEIEGISALCFQINKKGFLRLGYDCENQIVIINAELFDAKGNCVIKIKDNNYQMSTDVWDIKAKGMNLIFRNKLRGVFLNIEFNGNDNYIKIIGRIYFEEDEYLDVTNEGIFYRHILIYSLCNIKRAQIGLLVAPENEAPSSGGIFNGRATGGCVEGGEVGFFHTIELLNRYKEHGDKLPKDR